MPRQTHEYRFNPRIIEVQPDEPLEHPLESGVIGGDQGDIHWRGVEEEGPIVRFTEAMLRTGHARLDPDEVRSIAKTVFHDAYQSIGTEIFETTGGESKC